MKAVKAESVLEMKQSLTGRDSKVIISEALKHIPVLLEFAHAGEEAILAEMKAAPPPKKSTDEDFDLEGSSDDEDMIKEDDPDTIPRILLDAKAWDDFTGLSYSVRPFERDDQQYRQKRGVETFNAAGLVMAQYKRLQPGAVSACPHVALVVLPRQMVEHGDPGRRGTDHSESYGASIKDGIHRRCLRRKKATEASTHKRRGPDGAILKTWTQRPLAVSRIMQTYRDMAVRERLLRDEESIPYLLRKHYGLKTTGFATVGQAAAANVRDPLDSIFKRMSEGRELA